MPSIHSSMVSQLVVVCDFFRIITRRRLRIGFSPRIFQPKENKTEKNNIKFITKIGIWNLCLEAEYLNLHGFRTHNNSSSAYFDLIFFVLSRTEVGHKIQKCIPTQFRQRVPRLANKLGMTTKRTRQKYTLDLSSACWDPFLVVA